MFLCESQPVFVICGHHVVNIYFDQVKMSGNSFMFLRHYVKSLRRISPEFLASLFSSALIISVDFVVDTMAVREAFSASTYVSPCKCNSVLIFRSSTFGAV